MNKLALTISIVLISSPANAGALSEMLQFKQRPNKIIVNDVMWNAQDHKKGKNLVLVQPNIFNIKNSKLVKSRGGWDKILVKKNYVNVATFYLSNKNCIVSSEGKLIGDKSYIFAFTC